MRAAPTIFLTPKSRPGLIRDLSINLAGCALEKAGWVHHRFNQTAIGLVVSGRGTYQADDGPIRAIEPGCMFPVYPGPVFHYGPFEGTTWAEYHFGLDGPGVKRLVAYDWLPQDDRVHQLANVALVVEGIRELIRIVGRAGPGDADRSVLLAQRLLMEMYYSRAELQHANTPSKSMEAVLQYCRSNCEREIDFVKLATENSMSYSSLRQSMRKLTGMGPAHYVTHLKCERARMLLSDTDLSVKEIGARVGVDDPYTFSRIFKRHVGLSPQKFREQAAPWSQR
ncbi:MAG TPA: AraC family transcriptional regulator [Planctomycetota bacterium]|nr:AraC family transcriptional regulator [Planctomycetota bacterium]